MLYGSIELFASVVIKYPANANSKAADARRLILRQQGSINKNTLTVTGSNYTSVELRTVTISLEGR